MKNSTIITGGFFKKYKELVEDVMIPYQYEVLHDEEKSHAIKNLEIAAGLAEGEFDGWVFQDSDVYKWLEAVGYILQHKQDKDLQAKADKIVELIAKAQQEDGYLDTYFQIKYPNRKYKRLYESHELYCAGHFLEAAVAYYKATDNQLILDIATKLADQIDENFGPEEGKLHIADGHEESEIGLVKLYELTKNQKYLKLANYLLEVRGRDKETYEQQVVEETAMGYDSVYNDCTDTEVDLKMYQAHKPIIEQDEAVGHAVRFGYMATALTQVGNHNENEEKLKAAKRLWNNVTKKRMYITGGIGSTYRGEAFTSDYDLPNDTAYSETCAAISMVFYAKEMLNHEINSEYADVMERALYNTTIAGMSLDAKHFYYVNPLEVDPVKCKCDGNKAHVKSVRQEWFGCACCPPNIARLISSLEDYIYTIKENELYLNLFIENEYKTDNMELKLETNYPHEGVIMLNVNTKEKQTIGIRIPNWSSSYTIKVNGEEHKLEVKNGYALLNGTFDNDEVIIEFDMTARRNYSNVNISGNIGKAAVSRGPLVYCVEEVDNEKNLASLYLSEQAIVKEEKEDILGGIVSLTTEGERVLNTDNNLYTFIAPEPNTKKVQLKLIPYYAWANRGENEMRVWLNYKR